MPISNYLAAAYLDTVFRPDYAATSSTVPDLTSWSTLYVALHYADPTAEGNLGTEVAGGGYQRATLNSAMWSLASNGLTVLRSAVTFSSMPATVIRYIGLWTGLLSGNLLWYGDISPAWIDSSEETDGIQVESGGTLVIPPEVIVVGFQA